MRSVRLIIDTRLAEKFMDYLSGRYQHSALFIFINQNKKAKYQWLFK